MIPLIYFILSWATPEMFRRFIHSSSSPFREPRCIFVKDGSSSMTALMDLTYSKHQRRSCTKTIGLLQFQRKILRSVCPIPLKGWSLMREQKNSSVNLKLFTVCSVPVMPPHTRKFSYDSQIRFRFPRERHRFRKFLSLRAVSGVSPIKEMGEYHMSYKF